MRRRVLAAAPPPGGGRKEKAFWIHRALTCDPIDIETLRKEAVSDGGLLSQEIRRKVWPKLLSINIYNLPPKPGSAIRVNHRDYNQVEMDVRRSLRRFPKGMPEEERSVLQGQLTDMILYILRSNRELHYYQGYHDVAVTLLLTVGVRMGTAMLQALSTHHLRDFMDPTMDRTRHVLSYLMPLVQCESAHLHDFLLRSEVGVIFALSWLITWYGHVLSDFHQVLRLYDFFLASHPLMPVYCAAQHLGSLLPFPADLYLPAASRFCASSAEFLRLQCAACCPLSEYSGESSGLGPLCLPGCCSPGSYSDCFGMGS
ncbi:TBC1 domain family member 20-like isoform X2 [Hyperolius riggenbachi]|uniref:TBC1 domain family member 20-like isoform X2 n=1 Tax=Hyperolius riggenbachi TaxID=752182 RepID=UPI0035A30DFE